MNFRPRKLSKDVPTSLLLYDTTKVAKLLGEMKPLPVIAPFKDSISVDLWSVQRAKEIVRERAMTSSILKNIEADAARYGFVKHIGQGVNRHKTRWTLSCSKCPETFSAYWEGSSSPELMVKNMRQRRWDVGLGDRPLCPKCAHPRKEKAPIPKPPPTIDVQHEIYRPPATIVYDAFVEAIHNKFPAAEPLAISSKDTIMTNEATTPSPTPSPRISHAVFLLLDSVFDTEKRLYHSGYSDEKVARETGTSEQVVAHLRKEVYGELAEDPVIGALRHDIEKLKADIGDFIRMFSPELEKLVSRVDQMSMRHRK